MPRHEDDSTRNADRAAAVPTSITVHATVIARRGVAALLRGPSGAGKSDLALRLLAMPASPNLPTGDFTLISDDQVQLSITAGQLTATAPATIAGRMEVRGLGIVTLPATASARVVLVADLVQSGQVERLPEPDTVELLGVAVPLVRLAPFEASAPIKLALALDSAGRRKS